jgi:hypothetical protein
MASSLSLLAAAPGVSRALHSRQALPMRARSWCVTQSFVPVTIPAFLPLHLVHLQPSERREARRQFPVCWLRRAGILQRCKVQLGCVFVIHWLVCPPVFSGPCPAVWWQVPVAVAFAQHPCRVPPQARAGPASFKQLVEQWMRCQTTASSSFLGQRSDAIAARATWATVSVGRGCHVSTPTVSTNMRRPCSLHLPLA